MALSSNPSKTARIDKAHRRETRQRYKRYARDVAQLIRETQNGLIQNAIVTNAFDMSEDEFERFIRQLRNLAYRDILGVNDPANANSAVELEQTSQWQEKYIEASYARSLDRAIDETRAAVAAAGVTPEITGRDLRTLYETATDARIAQMLIQTNTLHGETVESIQRKSLTGLVQAIETMLAQLARETEKARVDPDATATTLIRASTERVRVASVTSEQVARSTTTMAQQEAQINHAKILSEKIGEDVNLRWITRVDARVRELHAKWHGQIMTPDEAAHNITVDPANCRCTFQQVPATKDTAKRQAQFDEERQVLMDEDLKASLGALPRGM